MRGRGKRIAKGFAELIIALAVVGVVMGVMSNRLSEEHQAQVDDAHTEYVAAVRNGTGAVVPASSNAAPYASYWFYSQLSSDEQQVYATLYEALYLRKDSVDLNFKGTARFEVILDCLFADCPEFSYAHLGGTYYTTGDTVTSYTFEYHDSGGQAAIKTAQLNNVANAIMEQVNAASTQQEKVRIIHDAIAQRCSYNDAAAYMDAETVWKSAPDAGTAYGALVGGSAICGGYAKAFEYLCHLAGIACIYDSGTADTDQMSGPHAWNLVQVDGTWYVCDVTWDDQEQMPGGIIYDYYLISDEQHDYVTGFDNPATVPACSSALAAA